ncbi:MAG TPA: enoyl-CoA hydratase-related protein [Blastocatellia bacterium]|jgi:cyclohexa-1,5-dienecarbonyl-CoA hydratase|nr:enoyl-CoA hydratase-related protein [Blastocatellia bacterium]
MPNPYKDIRFTLTNRVARITFARPPLNVLTISMMKEITDAINRVGSTPDVCAIVFAALPNSRTFSAGVSIEEHRPETVFQMLEAFHSIFRGLNSISKPVIVLVGGAALGGGCELVAFADIVIATQSARFGQPEIKLGVFPPLAAVILPRVIGEKKAREMILTGELLGAEAALALGLVNHVVADNELETRADEILEVLRQMSAPVLELSRRALGASSGLSFDEALKRTEDIYLNQLMSFKDAQEGIEAFIAKRQPRWKHK